MTYWVRDVILRHSPLAAWFFDEEGAEVGPANERTIVDRTGQGRDLRIGAGTPGADWRRITTPYGRSGIEREAYSEPLHCSGYEPFGGGDFGDAAWAEPGPFVTGKRRTFIVCFRRTTTVQNQPLMYGSNSRFVGEDKRPEWIIRVGTDVRFRPNVGETTGDFVAAWDGTHDVVGEWTVWTLMFDPTENTARLWCNLSDLGARTVTADFADPQPTRQVGSIEWGGGENPSNNREGDFAFAAVLPETALWTTAKQRELVTGAGIERGADSYDRLILGR